MQLDRLPPSYRSTVDQSNRTFPPPYQSTISIGPAERIRMSSTTECQEISDCCVSIFAFIFTVCSIYGFWVLLQLMIDEKSGQ